MEATPKVVEIFGLSFSVPILISCGVSVLLIALFTIFASRKVSMKPGKLQNALEALMDFTKGIVNSAVDEKTDRKSTRLNSSHIQKSRMPSSA